MGKGFFFSSAEVAGKVPLSLVPKCGTCGLHKHCNSPKMKPSGRGRRKVLIVGENPGNREDEQGEPFVGPAGQRLRQTLWKIGVDFKQDCWITNAIICWTGSSKDKNAKTIDYCRPNLLNTVRDVQPEIIILLGATAVKSLIGAIWKEDTGSMTRWAGWQIPCMKPNAWLCPTYHPSYLLRENDPVLDLYFEHHLQQAFALQGRPWDMVPDYRKLIRVEMDHEKAANSIRVMTAFGKPLALDIETNQLKPDNAEAEIVSCALSDGQTAVSYPWVGKAITATKELLVSKVPLIFSNFKFEYRWILAKLGIHIGNPWWDTMLAAHALDNRKGICSIKFQAFVLLGAEPWEEKIKPYLESKGGSCYSRNRIKELLLSQLLTYGGLDALLEYRVAMIQRRQMGLP